MALKTVDKIIRYVVIVLAAALAVVALHYTIRIFITDTFTVKGPSMEPCYHTGDRIRVNKLLLGARIYTDYDFTKSELRSFRMPGLRGMRRGEPALMNFPYANTNDTINFRINYVYMKRCFGLPGDTVRIVGGHYIDPETGGRLGNCHYQDILSSTPDSLLRMRGVVLSAYRHARTGWTIRDFGPFFIPSEGDEVELNPLNVALYGKMIQYETGQRPELVHGDVFIGDSTVRRYRFRTNWYFFGGDNVLDSRDSRYFGPVPEEYIIGILSACCRR